jgi:diaminohydroxyphosphoribosylaminopyrimidine deaminase/5-amino-6-(5-phosphoribosylamino)uracil reductase
MKEALRLARQGWGLVSPNPMVGAVLVKHGKIVGTGWHIGPGQAHAETACLAAAGKNAKGATLFVNLEPCRHIGRTGPCVEAIIKAEVAKVYYSIPDPNPEAAGGARILSEAGIEVDLGLMAAEAMELNQFFIKSCLTGRPFVILKTACSLDGKIATSKGDSRWISSKVARNYGHYLRAGVDAILIGRGTATTDNPELSARPWGKRKLHREPMRVVMDPLLKLPISLKIFDPEFGGPSLVFCSPEASSRKIGELEDKGITVKTISRGPEGLLSLSEALCTLGSLGIQSVLIESGATMAASAIIEEEVADLIHIFLAPKFLGGIGAPGMIGGKGVDSLNLAPEAEILKVGRKGPDLHLLVRPKTGFQAELDQDGVLSEKLATPAL